MLVLSRKIDQEIVINGNIKVRVLKVKGNTIRLGIEAPQDVDIVRGELEQRDSRQAVNQPQSDDVEANFSIVFDTNATADLNPPTLLPFEGAVEVNRFKNSVAGNQNPVEANGSIEFKAKLPETFQRNRLQEIVERMTTSN